MRRGTNYRRRMIEMHLGDWFLLRPQRFRCLGERAYGNHGAGTYAAGDMAKCAQLHARGLVNGGSRVRRQRPIAPRLHFPSTTRRMSRRKRTRVGATRRDDGLTPNEVEFKTRRLVNDYIQPPKITAKYHIAQQRLAEVREDLKSLVARDPHELMRALETQSILDCADMAAAASLYRTESRWGLYHMRTDYPETDNENWFCHTMLYKNDAGEIAHRKRPIDPYIVPVEKEQMSAYHQLRINPQIAAE